MKHLIISLFILSSSSVFSQIQEIDSICNQYDKKIAQAIEEEAWEGLPKIETKSKLIKRAIGPVEHLITIYFDEYEVELGQEGMDVFHKEAVIRKVEMVVESVSYKMEYSYYFDTGGLLIKYHMREVGYNCLERTWHFDDKKVVRVKQNPLEADCLENKPVETFDREPNADDKMRASWILDEAKKLREILFLNYELLKY